MSADSWWLERALGRWPSAAKDDEGRLDRESFDRLRAAGETLARLRAVHGDEKLGALLADVEFARGNREFMARTAKDDKRSIAALAETSRHLEAAYSATLGAFLPADLRQMIAGVRKEVEVQRRRIEARPRPERGGPALVAPGADGIEAIEALFRDLGGKGKGCSKREAHNLVATLLKISYFD